MIQDSAAGIPLSAQDAGQVRQVGNKEPRSDSERYLASLWSEIIGLENVELPGKFLELGGNSLTLNIILNRIEAEKEVSLEAELFFDPERSSLFEVAKELDALLANKSEGAKPNISCPGGA